MYDAKTLKYQKSHEWLAADGTVGISDHAQKEITDVVFAIDSGSFNPTSTDIFLVLILAAVFLGGPGQAYGAMLGAAVIGIATEVSAAFIAPDYKYVVAFVALLVMLGLRPTGLLGTPA